MGADETKQNSKVEEDRIAQSHLNDEDRCYETDEADNCEMDPCCETYCCCC